MGESRDMKVLIVEDHQFFSHVLERMLRKAFSKDQVDGSLQVEHAPTVAEGLRLTSEIRSFDLVVVDLMLPDGNGVEVVRKVKAQSPGTPVAVFSATRDLSEALAVGADDAMSKLTDISDIVARLKRLAEVPDGRGFQEIQRPALGSTP